MHLSASAPTPPYHSLSLCLSPFPLSEWPRLPPCSTRFPAASFSAAHGYLPRCLLRCDPVTVSCAHSQTHTHTRARPHTHTHTDSLTNTHARTHTLSLSFTHSLTRSATFERPERARVALAPRPICFPLPLKWGAVIHIWCSRPLSSPTSVPDSSGCHSCIHSIPYPSSHSQPPSVSSWLSLPHSLTPTHPLTAPQLPHNSPLSPWGLQGRTDLICE